MKDLIKKLNEASYAYYALDSPIISDKEYDELYDLLVEKENETGIILAGSPTQRVQGYVLDGFTKVKHSKPMLSADKTKDPEEIKRFVGDKEFYGSFKLDGLTIVTRFKNGEFVQGITRGNGIEGEDVTEACRFIKNLPMKIPYKGDLELRGECVISWDEFNRINSTLQVPYSHPRNLAAGTLRNLDLNVIKERELSFVVFECVTDLNIDSKRETLDLLKTYGFECVERSFHCKTIEQITELLQSEYSIYPCDGIIFEFDSNSYSKSLGATGHHERCRMALKWADDLYPTKLKEVIWQVGKTGVLTPVIVTEPVIIDGATVNRASVHNVSILKQLHLTEGCTCYLYKANMIIPQCDSADDDGGDEIKIPDTCPVCGGRTRICSSGDVETLECVSPHCKGILLGRTSQFVSKKGMNIDGLSEATLEKFIDLGWVTNLNSIYHLEEYFPKMKKLSGFGKKSVDNLAAAIEASKNVELAKFITSLSIPGIGEGQTKGIIKKFKTWREFVEAGFGDYDFSRISGIGDILNKNIHDWFNAMYFVDEVENLASIMRFKDDQQQVVDQKLAGKTFCITGKLKHFSSRDSLVETIENFGGKVSGSISSKTHLLINNDPKSNSSKNLKAQNLGIPIITEEEFIEIIK